MDADHRVAAAANVRSTLTARYVLALVLVALTLVITHSMAARRLDGGENQARAINLAGTQRMLSQHVALLARELTLAGSDGAADVLANRLVAALDEMESHHEELSGDWRARAAQGEAAYRELTDDGGLDATTRRYVAFARTLLNLYRWQSLEELRSSDLPERLSAIATDDVLVGFADVARRYERESAARIAEFRRLGELSMVAGLCLLIVEAMLIFQPMVRTVTSSVGALKEANEELRELGARIAHDLRAPVASSLGLVQVVDEAVVEGDLEEVADANARTRTALTRLDELLGDLLAVVRTHGAVPRRESVDLDVLVDEVIGSLDRAARENGVSVSRSGRSERRLHTDPALLRQVLWNLVSNAVRYADSGEACPAVRVTIGTWADRVRVDVIDNGLGIPEGSRRRMFEMFVRLHPTRSDGSGLGLYVARRSAVALGADLGYEPLDKGSRFRFSMAVRTPT